MSDISIINLSLILIIIVLFCSSFFLLIFKEKFAMKLLPKKQLPTNKNVELLQKMVERLRKGLFIFFLIGVVIAFFYMAIGWTTDNLNRTFITLRSLVILGVILLAFGAYSIMKELLKIEVSRINR